MDDDLKEVLDAMRQENAAAHVETRRYIDEVTAETRRYIDEGTAGTRRYIDEGTAGTRQHVNEVAAETRRHFDISTEDLKHEIQLTAEKVLMLDEKLDREAADIRKEMRTGFADTQAMIKFSHAELDRRVRALEGTQRTLEEVVSDLQSRVERLEGSTH